MPGSDFLPRFKAAGAFRFEISGSRRDDDCHGEMGRSTRQWGLKTFVLKKHRGPDIPLFHGLMWGARPFVFLDGVADRLVCFFPCHRASSA